MLDLQVNTSLFNASAHFSWINISYILTFHNPKLLSSENFLKSYVDFMVSTCKTNSATTQRTPLVVKLKVLMHTKNFDVWYKDQRYPK